MVSPEKQVAREVHELLLEARPQTDDANLARAAEITLSPDLVSHNDFREQFSISHLLFNATKEALDFLRPPQLAASFIQGRPRDHVAASSFRYLNAGPVLGPGCCPYLDPECPEPASVLIRQSESHH